MSSSTTTDSAATGLIALGWTLGGLNYLITAFTFFSRGDTSLGLIQLVVPPAELVLPWVADTRLGIISLVSLGLVVLGGSMARETPSP